jgi:hypothetical protein
MVTSKFSPNSAVEILWLSFSVVFSRYFTTGKFKTSLSGGQFSMDGARISLFFNYSIYLLRLYWRGADASRGSKVLFIVWSCVFRDNKQN